MKLYTFLAFAVVVQLCLIGTKSFGQSAPKMDWDKVTLTILKVHTVPQIEGNQYRLVPKSGQQLVALDIEGRVPAAMDVKLNPTSFVAKAGDKKIEASAVGEELAGGQFMWAIAGSVEGGMHVSPEFKWHQDKPGNIHFSVCFLMSNKIGSFELIVGKAAINAKIPK
jgi:hypothetical protein